MCVLCSSLFPLCVLLPQLVTGYHAFGSGGNMGSPSFLFYDCKWVGMRTQITHFPNNRHFLAIIPVHVYYRNYWHHCSLSKSWFGRMTDMRGIPVTPFFDHTTTTTTLDHRWCVLSIGERSNFTPAETSSAPFHLWWDGGDKAPMMKCECIILINCDGMWHNFIVINIDYHLIRCFSLIRVMCDLLLMAWLNWFLLSMMLFDHAEILLFQHIYEDNLLWWML